MGYDHEPQGSGVFDQIVLCGASIEGKNNTWADKIADSIL